MTAPGTELAGVPVGISIGAYPVGFPDGDWLLERGRVLEAAGFDAVLAGDRPLWDAPHYEPISYLGALTATTRRARVVGVILLPLRHPLLLARQLSFMHYASGGRFVLAAAIAGDYPAEFAALGVDVRDRVARHNESIAAMRHLWSGDEAPFVGRFGTYPGGQVKPLPPGGKVPVWLAHRARQQSSIRRTVEVADGWLASWVNERRLTGALESMAQHAEEVGRDLAEIEVAVLVRFFLAEDSDDAADVTARFREATYGLHSYDPTVAQRYHALGGPEAVRARLRAYLAAGAQSLILQPECPLAQVDEQLQRLRDEVLVPMGFASGRGHREGEMR
ncbi:MAG: LLM class flavin-dependent oxidoreductase [Acidimicrobiia bacterium]